jgi:pyruvate/2-oxoglutarate dehydrogenase complex dihydrolipoamide dehydrogenase (E3) component
MKGVRERKRKMVDADVREHLVMYEKSGIDLILGEGRMIGPRTLEVKTRDGTTRRLTADRFFLSLGTHATIPDIPGLAAARSVPSRPRKRQDPSLRYSFASHELASLASSPAVGCKAGGARGAKE